MDERIQRIIERWSLTEEAMFAAIYEHDIEPNENMSCPFRTGKGKVEYSPSIIAQLSDKQIELCLKAEAIRILLKHPYERQPVGCRRKSMSYGSNFVLADNYNFYDIGYKLPSAYNLPRNESYEYYAIQVENMPHEPDEFDDEEDEDGSNNGTSSAENTNSPQADTDGQTQSDSSADDLQDSYILTLADGSTIRIPKGDASATRGAGSATGGGAGGSTGGGGAQAGGNAQSNAGTAQQPASTNAQSNAGASQQPAGANAQSNAGAAQSGPAAPTAPVKKSKYNFSKGMADLSQLWEEDDFMGSAIDSIIEDTNLWGNIPGDIVAKIKANVKVKVDYRKVLSGFRASVLSSKLRVTRMRPNRRTGFDNMGGIRRFDTKLLVAVDVSGTISDASISRFYSAINRMFKYGMEHIDTVQFDYEMGEVKSFKKKVNKVTVVGRGGTSYQPVFDYVAEHPYYDGLIIFTDGYAEKPVLSKKVRTKIAWVCNNMRNYEINGEWMRQYGRCCAMEF